MLSQISREFISLYSNPGYYQVPEHSTIKLSPAVSHLQLTSGSSHHHRASGAGQLNQHRMRMRGGRHHHFGGGGGHPPPPLHETVPGGGGFAPGVSERADENGIVSNVYPSPGRLPLPPHHRVSDQAAEHGLTPNGEINVGGRSYSSAYYYYEYTPRGERGEDGEGEEEHSYDLAVVAEGLRQIRQLNTTFVASWDLVRFAKELVPMVRESVLRMENKELKAIVVLLFVLVIAVFMFYWVSVYCTITTTSRSEVLDSRIATQEALDINFRDVVVLLSFGRRKARMHFSEGAEHHRPVPERSRTPLLLRQQQVLGQRELRRQLGGLLLLGCGDGARPGAGGRDRPRGQHLLRPGADTGQGLRGDIRLQVRERTQAQALQWNFDLVKSAAVRKKYLYN